MKYLLTLFMFALVGCEDPFDIKVTEQHVQEAKCVCKRAYKASLLSVEYIEEKGEDIFVVTCVDSTDDKLKALYRGGFEWYMPIKHNKKHINCGE